MRFHQIIRQARIAKYISQREAGKLHGLDLVEYSRMEQGKVKIPLMTAMKLCELYGVPFYQELKDLWEVDNQNIPYPESKPGMVIACGTNGCTVMSSLGKELFDTVVKINQVQIHSLNHGEVRDPDCPYCAVPESSHDGGLCDSYGRPVCSIEGCSDHAGESGFCLRHEQEFAERIRDNHNEGIAKGKE
jgi:transcriptional regulator with XRE-family HTH domain